MHALKVWYIILCCYAIQDEEVVACKLKGVAESVNINVRFFNGSKFCVEAALESTVESFKEFIVGKCDIPIQNQRLIHKGKILHNHQSLKSYGTFYFLMLSCYFYVIFVSTIFHEFDDVCVLSYGFYELKMSCLWMINV